MEGKVPATAKQDTSQLTPTAKSASNAAFEEVSQPVLQPCLSVVLAKYQEYLKSCYEATPIAPADKYLPVLNTSYINLAMITKGHHSRDKLNEFTKRTLHGGIDQILESKAPIKIEKLLVSEDGSESVRFILVEGPPGIGKSTFAWEVCRKWNIIESLKKYQIVVLLKLREKWVLNAKSPSDLFRYPPDPEMSAAIAKDINDSHGQNLLLVLDGFDEIPHTLGENLIIKSILCRQIWSKCAIILTTRPSAKHTLKRVCQPRVDKHVEIIGFTEEERVKYITEVFSKEPELQVNFLKYMFLVPHIKSMMYIPLNCAIIAQVYYESQQSSNCIAIPRTRTELYQVLTHSLLVRHQLNKGNHEYTSILPDGLNKEDMDKFKILAKFAFDAYHTGTPHGPTNSSEPTASPPSQKVTFFREDIPEGLVHFGFMNESSEMYVSKGVEKTFTFLHLSLQEYLAAWHVSHSYSTEFQVAYHSLAVGRSSYMGCNRKEESHLSSLLPLRELLMEPALFLAGTTGFRYQSQSNKNLWEEYLCNSITDGNNSSILHRSLYEAQSPNITARYFTVGARRRITIDSSSFALTKTKLCTPYDSYALTYCLANSSDRFQLSFCINNDDDIFILETFVKGLEDHCTPQTPLLESLSVKLQIESDTAMGWLMQLKFLPELKSLYFECCTVKSHVMFKFLQLFVKLQSLTILFNFSASLNWLAAIKSFSELRELFISSGSECSPPETRLDCLPLTKTLVQVVINIHLPSKMALNFPTNTLVEPLLKSVLQSNQIAKLCLHSISRETMAGVHSILIKCPSLVSLELKRTRLGYDGILFICNALKCNTKLKQLIIYDHIQVSASMRQRELFNIQFTAFSRHERIVLPDKTSSTDFLLELDNIIKTSASLEQIDIQSGLLLPFLSRGHREYRQWTGFGPLQQFNIGAVCSGRPPNLRRSFSSSDLTQPKTLLFWDQHLEDHVQKVDKVTFNKLFSKRKEEGKKLFTLISFTAPDTEVIPSFSNIDHRLKRCLGITELNDQYIWGLQRTSWGMFWEISQSMQRF